MNPKDNSTAEVSGHTKTALVAQTGNDFLNPDYPGLVEQIEAEYQSAWRVLQPKITKWQQRLKVYNNQRRDQDAIGDTLLFSVMQTVIASLYDDQMTIEFTGKNEGDEDVAGNQNHLAEYDYDVMRKDEFDYHWLWDTGFFGRSIVYFTTFSRERDNTPLPELQNPMLFLRDPKAVSVNGDILRRNAARFFGRWIELMKQDMEQNPEFFDIDHLEIGETVNSDIALARQAYQDAQGLNNSVKNDEANYKDNAMYDLLEWCTHYKDPKDGKVKKVLVTLGNNRKKIVRVHWFKFDGKPAVDWPVIDRPMYPTAHDWDGTSIPDIVEDKQRMRAVLQNLAIKNLKADIYPMKLFNKNRIKNRNDLNFGFGKNVPVEGDGPISDAVMPMPKQPMNVQLHTYIMDSLQNAAEKATSSPEMQQGNMMDQRRTATELSMVDRNVGTRYTLTAKVFAWSERRFWMQWYRLYKDNFKQGIDEKVVRLEGAFGAKFRPLTREDIVSEVDPDIRVTAKSVTDQKRLAMRQDFTQYVALAAQVPNANVRYAIKKLGRMINLEKDEVDRIFPPSIDERIAEDENSLLNKNKAVKVKFNQDHEAHLEIHAKAADTPATFAHIQSHIRALEIQQANPNLAPQQGAQPGQQPGQATPQQPGQDPMDSVGAPGKFPQTAQFDQRMANSKDLMSMMRSVQGLPRGA